MNGTLVIVPCGQGKVWDKNPHAGPTPAREAYTGAPFKVNRRYAEHFGDRWVILSAKYGFIAPDFLLPGPYNITFKKPSTNPVSVTVLTEQIMRDGLAGFRTVIVLGGKEYRAAVREAFTAEPVTIVAPFAGLPIGKMMQATKGAIEAGETCPLLHP